MANYFTLTSVFCFLLLATPFVTSARILDEITPPLPLPADDANLPQPSDPIPPPETAATAQPDGPIPATNAAPDITPTQEPADPAVIAPAADIPAATATAPLGGAAATPGAQIPATNAAPTTAPAADVPGAGAAAPEGSFSFFMHDILGGSHPSGRAVAGIVANSDANNLPFSKPSNPIFPINGGVPLNTINGVINNNNYPFLVGLNGNAPNTLIQSNGNNAVAGSGSTQAFVTAGQLPQGLTVQQLMFGSVTVVDNELTEGHELGTGVLGRAQGIYITSSTDGSSHTLVLTAAFHGHEHDLDDTISFFGVHRTATPISHIAIVGGTGKYENAKGYATIETLPQHDQHTTDGIETITHFTVYITP